MTAVPAGETRHEGWCLVVSLCDANQAARAVSISRHTDRDRDGIPPILPSSSRPPEALRAVGFASGNAPPFPVRAVIGRWRPVKGSEVAGMPTGHGVLGRGVFSWYKGRRESQTPFRAIALPPHLTVL